MNSITRQPRILVKMPPAPAETTLAMGRSRIGLRITPLFESIRPMPTLGATAAPVWHLLTAGSEGDEVNSWDLCHHLLREGLGIAGGPTAVFAEPDLEQKWISGSPAEQAFAAAQSCTGSMPPDPRVPTEQDIFWFRATGHSQLQAARDAVGRPGDRIRIAHLDTGYDPNHSTRPEFLRTDLQRNYVDESLINDATDRSPAGLPHNLGHGTGTLSILAGAAVDGSPLGGAAFLEVVPIRVANEVEIFKNSAVATAFDYVHMLGGNPATRVDVVTMSMGGLASDAWADAINALYELGVFVVTAAGNNFGNLPTHNIVFPARFKRVVAACGVMANGRPYADLPFKVMAGNYGPESKMATAIAGCTPNTPWARRGCPGITDHNGAGTSAATPQVAAAAALWIQKYRAELAQYPEAWMRVEAVRKALFDSAKLAEPGLRARLGHGMVQAEAALEQHPAPAAQLRNAKQPPDSASFPFLRVLTGLGIARSVDARQRMLELEALQLTQRSQELERLLPDPETPPDQVSPADRQRFIDALAAAPGASDALKNALGRHAATIVPRGGSGAPTPAGTARNTSPPAVPAAAAAPANPVETDRLKRAMDPPIAEPASRQLRVFAFDPLAGSELETLGINETTLAVTWEKDLKPGPVGEYLEVVDIDPATGVAYAPVDLNHPTALSQQGFTPSESNPRFHQQMVYAVAMKTIEHFERALGRVALWAPRIVTGGNKIESIFVRRLRIYPHAMREANSYYSPEKKSLLLGYLQAPGSRSGKNLPGGTVFCCLSHDIVAHETTHALLDGLHRYFQTPSNPDVLAFHEAFADIVALFQHFTVPEALQNQIAKTRGNLGKENLLAELAQQFGQAIGNFGALRSAIVRKDRKKKDESKEDKSKSSSEASTELPAAKDYTTITEAHDRGAVLVGAVFDAFLGIYRVRSQDLVRLATSGTGVLPKGDIPYDLVNRLAREASKTAEHVLRMCIRALDYCPPVDITFGDYLRALITADKDLVPDDKLGYRVAFVQAFRHRGIYPTGVRNLSAETLSWESPELRLDLDEILPSMTIGWDLKADRYETWKAMKNNARRFHEWLRAEADRNPMTESLGFYSKDSLTVGGVQGALSGFEVHSVRPVRRVGPDGQQQLDLLVEITQSWTSPKDGSRYRGGCTLLIDWDEKRIRYCIRKRVGHAGRIEEEANFRMTMTGASPRSTYFRDGAGGREPFAMLHRRV